MEDHKKGQVVVILSPQDWSHQFISKHHYAVEFSKQFDTIFVSPTVNKFGKLSFSKKIIDEDNPRLYVAHMVLPFPNWIRFKINKVYRIVNRIALNHFLKNQFRQEIKLVIDFGCHKAIDRLDKFQNAKSIYFPVDDYKDLPIKTRYADKLFTVSSNIQEKFEQSNIPITWINHGLSSVFAEKAKVKLEELKKKEYPKENIRNNIGYAGNLCIPFLDRMAVLNTITSLPDFTFHFFGNYANNDKDAHEFIHMLRKHNNVILHGQLSTENLAEQLFQMDILWLCYKADGKNYHLENSHKILEYLATGLPIVSSPIKYLKDADKDFLYQIENKKHAEVILDIKNKKDDSQVMIQRIEFSLKATYRENVMNLLSL
jgi:glycosyltransferase involved in cell wall biosynthesis